jgi:hypothetical protein
MQPPIITKIMRKLFAKEDQIKAIADIDPKKSIQFVKDMAIRIANHKMPSEDWEHFKNSLPYGQLNEYIVWDEADENLAVEKRSVEKRSVEKRSVDNISIARGPNFHFRLENVKDSQTCFVLWFMIEDNYVFPKEVKGDFWGLVPDYPDD